MPDWLFFVIAGGVVITLVRMHKRVPSDRCYVFYTSGTKPLVRRIQLSGLAFLPPWRRVKTLYLGAVPFTVDGAELGLSPAQPLRFLVGVENDWRRMMEAAERLAGLEAPELAQTARGAVVATLAGVRVANREPAERLRLAAGLTEDLRSALAARSMRLLSCNLDGLFGDEPGSLER